MGNLPNCNSVFCEGRGEKIKVAEVVCCERRLDRRLNKMMQPHPSEQAVDSKYSAQNCKESLKRMDPRPEAYKPLLSRRGSVIG